MVTVQYTILYYDVIFFGEYHKTHASMLKKNQVGTGWNVSRK
jgi:hypothetical protein